MSHTPDYFEIATDIANADAERVRLEQNVDALDVENDALRAEIRALKRQLDNVRWRTRLALASTKLLIIDNKSLGNMGRAGCYRLAQNNNVRIAQSAGMDIREALR